MLVFAPEVSWWPTISLAPVIALIKELFPDPVAPITAIRACPAHGGVGAIRKK